MDYSPSSHPDPPNNSSMKSSCRSSAASHSFGTAASRSSVSGSGCPRPVSIAITLIALASRRCERSRTDARSAGFAGSFAPTSLLPSPPHGPTPCTLGGYPIVVAGVFATITGVSSALIGELGDPEGATNIGALIPFFMMVLMAKGFIIATPFIVRAISGNIMMPALSGGLGGAYGFARAAMGNQQAYNRYLVGGASGAEYAALRARQFFGAQQMPQRPGMAQTVPASGNPSTGTGSQMLAQLARLGRLGRR